MSSEGETRIGGGLFRGNGVGWTVLVTDSIEVSEFAAVCLRLLEDVYATGEPIQILRNGQPLAVVCPPPVTAGRAPFGVMRDTLAGEIEDLVTPLDEIEWKALAK